MDPNHVHDFWGLSRPLDLQALYSSCCASCPSSPAQASSAGPAAEPGEDTEPQCGDRAGEGQRRLQAALLVGSSDCRHVLATLCHAGGHTGQKQELWLYEPHAEGLARQMLLIATFLDPQLHQKERVGLLLELHGNALLHEKAAEYLEQKGRQLAELLLGQRGGGSRKLSVGQDTDSMLTGLFDFSQLKYKEVDELVAVLRSWRRSVPFDMKALWEQRQRKFYADRFDARHNLVDWDYSMRVSEVASIVHAAHFKAWRESGVAYDARQCSEPNRSLASEAQGRMIEGVSVSGEQQGRSISKRGYWGDILSSPYIAFGAHSDDPALFRKSNKQHVHTAVDVAEANIAAWLATMSPAPHAAPLHEADNAVCSKSGGEAGEERADTLERRLGSERVDTGACFLHSEQSSIGGSGEADCGGGSFEAGANGGARQEENGHAQGESTAEALTGFKVVLVTGEFGKSVTSRAKLRQHFDAVVLGSRQLHLVSQGLERVTKTVALLSLEGAPFMLELRPEQQQALHEKVLQLATTAGWKPLTVEKHGEVDEWLFFAR